MQLCCYFGSQCRRVLLDDLQYWSVYSTNRPLPIRTGRYHDNLYIQDLIAGVLYSVDNLHIREAKKKTAMTYCTTFSKQSTALV